MFGTKDIDAVDVPPEPKPSSSPHPKFFSKGNPNTNNFATVLDEDWCNMITIELLEIVYKAGMDPDPLDNKQLVKALAKLFLGMKASVKPDPDTVALRDSKGRTQVNDPAEPLDAVNYQTLQKAMKSAGVSGPNITNLRHTLPETMVKSTQKQFTITGATSGDDSAVTYELVNITGGLKFSKTTGITSGQDLTVTSPNTDGITSGSVQIIAKNDSGSAPPVAASITILGQTEWVFDKSTNWNCPIDWPQVDVFAGGAGGGAGWYYGSGIVDAYYGGAGGGCGKARIRLTKGNHTIVVGKGGTSTILNSNTCQGAKGGSSSFDGIVIGYGGEGGVKTGAQGGGGVGDVVFSGGNGAVGNSSNRGGNGGGGAGDTDHGQDATISSRGSGGGGTTGKDGESGVTSPTYGVFGYPGKKGTAGGGGGSGHGGAACGGGGDGSVVVRLVL